MPLDHIALKKEIVTACLEVEKLGYVIGTYGNVSARVPGGLLITPSRVEYQSLTCEDIVTVSDEGEQTAGSRLPSSELEVHRQIYCARGDVRAVIHTHSFFATALSCLHATIPVIVEEQSQVIGDEIRCTTYVPAGRHRELGAEVARALGRSNAVLLANHGTLSCGRSLDDALLACRVTERVSQMLLLTSGLGKPVSIPDAFVKSERERWLFKYGTAGDGVLR